MNGEPTYDELIAANQKLKEKVEWLENAYRSHQGNGTRIKSRFLSNVSHEIRTPMNAILGFSNLLQNEKLTKEEKEEYLFYISHNSEALLNVMDNIIDLTLLETENLEIGQETVSIQDLVTQVYEFQNKLISRMSGERVVLLLSMPDNRQGTYVNVDSYRLRRVMDNLVSCALKYQKKGAIEMKLKTPDNQRVVFSVGLEGNAVLIERAKKIFEKNGSDNDWHNQLDNTGVVCKLARGLIEAMDGTINLDSVDRNRAEIVISLPVYSTVQERSGAEMQIKENGEIPAFNSN